MNPKVILVCDDQPEIGDIVRRVAEPLGYAVHAITRSRAFDAAFHEAAPAVVVLDIVMPDRDGIEVVQWLAQSQFKGRLILVSGADPSYLTSARTIAERRGLPSVTALFKPISVTALRDALGEAT